MHELQDRAEVDIVLDDAITTPPGMTSVLNVAGPNYAPYALESIRFSGKRATLMLRQRNPIYEPLPRESFWRIRLDGGSYGAAERTARAQIVGERFRGNRLRLVLQAVGQWSKRTQE